MLSWLSGFAAGVFTFTYQSWWVLNGIAHALVFYVIGRFLIYGYREHAYLYQFNDRHRSFDNAVKMFAPHVARFKLPRYRAFVTRHLGRAGYRLDLDNNAFLTQQCLAAVIAFAGAYVALCLLLNMPFIVAIFVAAVFGMAPLLKLHETSQKRFISCSRDLPFFIDYLTLAMGAGLDFNHALATVIQDAPASPLKMEFSRVMRNMKLGMNREDALIDMEARLESPALRLFTQTLTQAMRMGSDVVNTLVVMSETMQLRRFQAAEEAAGKISVKMMIPMMIFVMPATMIILMGPMLLDWFQNVR